jgi:hypothetical protein
MFIKLTPNSNPYFNSKLKFADFVDEDNNSVRRAHLEKYLNGLFVDSPWANTREDR